MFREDFNKTTGLWGNIFLLRITLDVKLRCYFFLRSLGALTHFFIRGGQRVILGRAYFVAGRTFIAFFLNKSWRVKRKSLGQHKPRQLLYFMFQCCQLFFVNTLWCYLEQIVTSQSNICLCPLLLSSLCRLNWVLFWGLRAYHWFVRRITFWAQALLINRLENMFLLWMAGLKLFWGILSLWRGGNFRKWFYRKLLNFVNLLICLLCFVFPLFASCTSPRATFWPLQQSPWLGQTASRFV